MAQVRKLTEFFPAEPLGDGGLPAGDAGQLLAAGLPHTSSAIGDGRGPYLGYACGTTRYALMLDAVR